MCGAPLVILMLFVENLLYFYDTHQIELNRLVLILAVDLRFSAGLLNVGSCFLFVGSFCSVLIFVDRACLALKPGLLLKVPLGKVGPIAPDGSLR